VTTDVRTDEMKIAREASKLTKEEWREYTKTVWHIANVTNANHPAVFPDEIPHRLIKLFSFVGETVLDPFAGVGTTARVAVGLDRRAVSVELNPEYATLISQVVKSSESEVHEADSRRLTFIGDATMDLVVTSPPYWNKADYGAQSSNLGNVAGYQRFLDEMRSAFAEAYRVLRPGRKICVVTANVNQHTDHGLLTFPLAADFTILLRDAGFVMINELIWSKDRTGGRWGSAGVQRPIFGSYPYPPNFLFKNVHEYILVFAKPGVRPTTGPKVMNYEGLMSQLKDVTTAGAAPENGTIDSVEKSNGATHPNGAKHSRNGNGARADM
jgi:DNA modification methylase